MDWRVMRRLRAPLTPFETRLIPVLMIGLIAVWAVCIVVLLTVARR